MTTLEQTAEFAAFVLLFFAVAAVIAFCILAVVACLLGARDLIQQEKMARARRRRLKVFE